MAHFTHLHFLPRRPPVKQIKLCPREGAVAVQVDLPEDLREHRGKFLRQTHATPLVRLD